ncbi:MAG: UTP--glucose-1-phosphate uridylyltransferase, partial [Planctomycetota bacterium]|nr:UTP--glucose-1-phosphate uridylyltransferase [Planctomycetota bacterium]
MIKGRNERERVTIAKVYRARQGHIFRWWEELSEEEKDSLLAQVSSIDFRFVTEMGRRLRLKSSPVSFGELMLPPVVHLPQTETDEKRFEDAKAVGKEHLRKGKVAVATVAGGVSSRMGLFDSKALLKVGPITGKTLIQLFAEKIAAIRKRYSTLLPWLIMTSDATDKRIREFFEENQNFGLAKGTVHFLKQGMVPVLDERGKLVMEEKGRIALSPDGHGGFFDVLVKSGLLEGLLKNGIEDLFYFQVDNPAVKVADPTF